MTYFTSIDWPLGRLMLISDGEALTAIWFHEGRHMITPEADWISDARVAPFAAAARQLEEYWTGRRQVFELPLRPRGTAFQQRVWTQIARVPLGQTISYRELALRAGSPDGSRAAGLATGRNPISIVVPCHRIVGTNGSLTGFGGGLGRKQALLEFEAAVARGEQTRLMPRTLFALDGGR